MLLMADFPASYDPKNTKGCFAVASAQCGPLTAERLAWDSRLCDPAGGTQGAPFSQQRGPQTIHGNADGFSSSSRAQTAPTWTTATGRRRPPTGRLLRTADDTALDDLAKRVSHHPPPAAHDDFGEPPQSAPPPPELSPGRRLVLVALVGQLFCYGARTASTVVIRELAFAAYVWRQHDL
jgi:hypothetical protein